MRSTIARTSTRTPLQAKLAAVAVCGALYALGQIIWAPFGGY